METSGLNAELLREIDCLEGDSFYLQEALSYVKRLVIMRNKEKFQSVDSELSKSELKDSLRQSLDEWELHKQGKLQLMTWDELKKEFDNGL